MRKNKINRREIIQLGKKEALDLFQEEYGITPDDARSIEDLDNFGRVFYGTAMLLSRALEKGFSKCEAIAQLTNANIAVLATEWTSPEEDTRNVGNIISKHYQGQNGRNTKSTLLRMEAAKYLLGSGFLLNSHNPLKNPGWTDFSFYDELDGLKLPPLLSFEPFFLMGVYRTDGNPADFSKNRFKVSGKTGDEELYKECLEGLIEDTFNLRVNTQVVSRERKTDSSVYEWNDVYIEVISQGHFAYLKDYIRLFDESGRFLPLDIEGLASPDEDINNCYTAYLMGMIAGGGHIAKRGTRVVLEFNDQQQNYKPELVRVLNKGFPFKCNTPERKPRYMSINQKNIEAMAEFTTPFTMYDSQIGLFVNPRHTKIISQL